MSSLEKLFKNNLQWSNLIKSDNPEFFTNLIKGQNPDFLWIGCSDSRVPAERLTGLYSGELFVHRNIANQVINNDINCLSVVQYAVDILKVKHIIICGHYDCGGIHAAIENKLSGFIKNWIDHIVFLDLKHNNYLKNLSSKDRVDKLAEINVVEQMFNLGCSSVLKNAWEQGQNIEIHAVIYGIGDGRLEYLGCCNSYKTLQNSYDIALKKYLI